MAIKVKESAVGAEVSAATISSKNQLTIPVAALRRAGLAAGDRVRVDVDPVGRVVITPIDESPEATVRRLADGALDEIFPADFVDEMKRDWTDRW